MELNNKIRMHFSLQPFSAAFLLTLATSASAAPGTLSDVPLYTRGSAEPNIMFVLDSSGSMNEMVWPPEGYDSAVQIPCANGITDGSSENYRVEFRVKRADGSVEFRVIDTYDDDEVIKDWSTWDTDGECFADDDHFGGWFYADDEDSTYYETGSGSSYFLRRGDDDDERVSGRLLNWYFSEQNGFGNYVAAKFVDDEGDAKRSKVDIRRTDVMKTAAAELVSDLEDVRVGLMQFNGSSGAKMLAGLTSVNRESSEDPDPKADLLDIIASISADGNTPLGESYEDVGRYFITGYENQNLTFKQESRGSVRTVSKDGDDVFESEPEWNSVTKPDNTVAGGAIQYYCQKSFMVALTDGDPTSDSGVTNDLDDYDYDCEGPAGCTGDGDDNYSMDDVVKALYDIDLRPDLTEPDGTPVKHNIASYMIGFANDTVSNSAVMRNAAYLGSGGHVDSEKAIGVYSANNSSQLKVTFNQIVNKVHEIVGSSSSVAFNSTSLEADSALYAAKFNSGDWSGELSALTIDGDGNIASTASWEASKKLATDTPAGRVMLTSKGGTGVAFTGAGLNLDTEDSANEQDLNINTSTGEVVTDNRAADRIDYLRGDRTEEGTASDKFRQRGSRLGDIVNSTPVYVGAPKANWPSTAPYPTGADSYATFKSTYASRTPVVYVGANDGFMHGFNATTTDTDMGRELIAYSPSVLVSSQEEYGLHALTSQNYNHKYYVDGTPTVGDAVLNGKWRTVLVGGLGGGGKGFFALDITNPANFTEANAASLVLWEFTSADNSNLGYSFARPQIGRMANGEWAAIFGNGYNSSTGDAGLFIRYLDGDDGAGNSYKWISTGTADATEKNGLSTPAVVDTNLDGTIDRIYAGDLKGNMWAFDVSSATSSNWDVAYSDITAPQPLFTVTGEPITGAPLVARNTSNTGGASPNLLVTFGSGQYLTAADTANDAAGGFYTVSDNGSYGLDKGDLVARAIGTTSVAQPDGSTRLRRTLSGAELDWSSKSGWYIPLVTGGSASNPNDAGERVINRPDLLRNVLFFNTLIPTGEVCSAGGYGWLMSVDVRTGLAPVKFAVFDGTGDGEINSADQGLVGQLVDEGIPNKPGFLNGDKQYTPTSAGTILKRDVNVGGGEREGRLSWEEITPD